MREIVKVHKRTREVVARYKGQTACDKAEGYGNGTARRKCDHKLLNADEFYLRWADEFDPDEDLTGKANCPMVSIDPKTDEVRWYPTRNAAAKANFVTASAISGAMRRGITCNLLTFKRCGKRF